MLRKICKVHQDPFYRPKHNIAKAVNGEPIENGYFLTEEDRKELVEAVRASKIDVGCREDCRCILSRALSILATEEKP